MNFYLRAKFQVSSITLTSFKKGVGERGRGEGYFYPPQSKPLKSPSRLGLNCRQISILFANSFSKRLFNSTFLQTEELYD